MAIWSGTEAETQSLLVAIGRYCACPPVGPRCAMHTAILDQRVLDHLLFARRIVKQLVWEEFDPLVDPAEATAD